MTDKKYDVIVADPSWSYKAWSGKKSRTADSHYITMTAKQIMDLPVHEIAAENSVLWLWATNPQLPLAMRVMAEWGFEFVTVGFCWVKLTKAGTPRMGLGHHSRSGMELCLLGRRGKGLPRLSKAVRQVIEAPVTEHSAKPEEAMHRIIKLYGEDVSRIELFSRGRHFGFDAFGDEADKGGTPAADSISRLWGSKLVTESLVPF